MEVVFGFVNIPLSIEVIVVEFGFEPIPLSVEVIVVEFDFEPIPLNVEVIVVVWLCPHPSIERLILCGLVSCLLCRGCCCCLREDPSLYYPNPQWRFLVWEVLCGRFSENPSV